MLELDLRFSRIGFSFLLCCHVGALVALLYSRLPLPLLALAAGAIAISLLRLGLASLSAYAQGCGCLCLGQAAWALSGPAGEVCTGPPCVQYLGEYLMVLRLQPLAACHRGVERPVHLVLWPDSLSEEQDRRLRRYLRFDCPSL